MAMSVTHMSGTASINAGEVNVIGQNTTWVSSGLLPGDIFWAAGLNVRILAIQDNTHMTLASPWPGASRAGAQYEIWRTPDIDRMGETQRAFLDKLAGNLFSFADLDSAADQMPYFIGKGVLGRTALTAKARDLLDDQTPAAMRLTTGTAYESGSNANGSYIKFPDGTQICTRSFVSTVNINQPYGPWFYASVPWQFPASFPQEDFAVGAACRIGGQVTLIAGGDHSQIGWDSFIVSQAAMPAVSATFKQFAIGRWF